MAGPAVVITPAQLKALEAYVNAVCYHMLNHVATPHAGMAQYRKALADLEREFNISPVHLPNLL